MHRFIEVLFIVCLLIVPIVGRTTDISQQESLYTLGKNAAVVIAVQKKVKQSIKWFGGSGVLIDAERGYVLTARHNVESRVTLSKISCLLFHNEVISRQLMPEEVAKLAAINETTCTIVEEDESLDIVLLQLAHVPDNSKAILTSSKPVKVGQPVYGVLAPNHMVNTYYEGYVNNVMSFANLNITEKFNPGLLFGYTSPMSSGASGGMVLDEQGHLIGITVANVFGMNTGVAIPMEIILKKFKALQDL